jgi:hypothetical protein
MLSFAKNSNISTWAKSSNFLLTRGFARKSKKIQNTVDALGQAELVFNQQKMYNL